PSGLPQPSTGRPPERHQGIQPPLPSASVPATPTPAPVSKPRAQKPRAQPPTPALAKATPAPAPIPTPASRPTPPPPTFASMAKTPARPSLVVSLRPPVAGGGQPLNAILASEGPLGDPVRCTVDSEEQPFGNRWTLTRRRIISPPLPT
ncbi:hypothetical protein EDB84DRAFT_1573185, partial [Lactarius hengduanensis]